MASDPFFSAVLGRRTVYALSDSSPIPDSRIQEIVVKAIKHSPSTFNVQSARAVILLKDEHRKFWDYALEFIKAALPEEVVKQLGARIAGFRAAYGSVLFFEAKADLDALAQEHAIVAPFITEWSDTSSGINQFAVWAALSAEGLGANLQHYNFLPPLVEKVKAEWNIPQDWLLKSQLVFGTPTGGPREKTFKPVEDRVKVYGQ
ncbi:hypothetical protein UA08_01702 [Talaromyces atroroseus]|uniref:Nitroreductase domain-containing protein n=1 Tax=Talaromyces atroroseus TaxID=1441469 RepID=A0A1Q5QA50_TALAT|nr:hypothetical protein UA08_01702 [Talaromyces atroroseus]OKL62823.1 hypothetical protein UA08_01702 [Talaromyces atroroseus]